MVEPEESLTLDVEARTRAADALSKALEGGYRGHYCAEWTAPGDECEICWDVAAAVIRAAEGLLLCKACNGMGSVGPEGDCCPDCGGNGLAPMETTPAERGESDG